MSKWLLMVFLIRSNSGVDIHVVEFENEISCERAAEIIKKVQNQVSTAIGTACFHNGRGLKL